MACASATKKLLHNEGKLTLLPGRQGWRPCLSPSELRPGETLEEHADGTWCVPRASTQSCRDLMAWYSNEWARLGRSPYEHPGGGGGRYANPYGVIACREHDKPSLGPFFGKDYQGQLRIYGQMPWETPTDPRPGAAKPPLFQVVSFTKQTPALQIPAGAVAVFDSSISKYRILAPT